MAYGFGYGAICLHRVGKTAPCNVFGLQDAVHPLGYGIVSRVTVLSHADGRAQCLESAHIHVAAVLDAAVAVVDKQGKVIATLHCGRYGHVKRLKRVPCVQRGRQAPAHNLAGEHIGDKMQVAHAAIGKQYIGDVTHPQTVGSVWLKIFHQIGPFVEVMIGVCRATAFAPWQSQTVLLEQPEERVAAHHVLTAEDVNKHQVYLVRTHAWSFFTYLADLLKSDGLYGGMTKLMRMPLVVGLAAFAKQPAESLY